MPPLPPAPNRCAPAVNIALHERAHPAPKIEVQHEDALSAHKAFIGLRQQIVPLNSDPWKDAALNHNVAVGETGQHRCHDNAVA